VSTPEGCGPSLQIGTLHILGADSAYSLRVLLAVCQWHEAIVAAEAARMGEPT
jgi:hypothetical protein